jgi:hypothetical protein
MIGAGIVQARNDEDVELTYVAHAGFLPRIHGGSTGRHSMKRFSCRRVCDSSLKVKRGCWNEGNLPPDRILASGVSADGLPVE